MDLSKGIKAGIFIDKFNSLHYMHHPTSVNCCYKTDIEGNRFNLWDRCFTLFFQSWRKHFYEFATYYSQLARHQSFNFYEMHQIIVQFRFIHRIARAYSYYQKGRSYDLKGACLNIFQGLRSQALLLLTPSPPYISTAGATFVHMEII